MKTQQPSPSDKPESKAIYIPGPIVASIKTLIDAYRDNNTQAVSAALQQLEQVMMETQPSPRKARKASALPKPPKKVAYKVDAEFKPRKRGRKSAASAAMVVPVSSVGADSSIDLIACLNRDHPAIAERYAMGEFRTAKEAAIAAGIVVAS